SASSLHAKFATLRIARILRTLRENETRPVIEKSDKPKRSRRRPRVSLSTSADPCPVASRPRVCPNAREQCEGWLAARNRHRRWRRLDGTRDLLRIHPGGGRAQRSHHRCSDRGR